MASDLNGDSVTTYILRTEDIDPKAMKFRDLLDIADATGIDAMQLSAAISGKLGSGSDRLKELAAFVWVIERRKNPELTFDQVLDGRVEIVGDKVDPTVPVAQT